MEIEHINITNLEDFLRYYEIDFTQSLDQKGLGSVYICTDVENQNPMAVKSIEMHPMFDKGTVLERYKAAIDLSHPNLLNYIAAYRFEQTNTVQNFVLMPYIETRNLQEWMPQLNLQQKKEIIESILNVLAYLHRQGHVWQVLRADHFLIDKVEDIIIPLAINYGATEILPSALFINYEYLAPEQLVETRKLEISNRTDIWSLGVLIYELFTGQLPFGRKSPQSPNKKIQSRILEDDIPNLIEKIPNPYRAVVKKCLEKEPEKRWTHVDEIKEYLAENPSEEGPKQLGVLETLGKMADSDVEYDEQQSDSNKVPFLQRKIKRKPSKPVSWLEVFLWIGFAILVGYLLSIWH